MFQCLFTASWGKNNLLKVLEHRVPNKFPSLGRIYIWGTLASPVRRGLAGPDPDRRFQPPGQLLVKQHSELQAVQETTGVCWSNFLVQVMESPTRGEELPDLLFTSAEELTGGSAADDLVMPPSSQSSKGRGSTDHHRRSGLRPYKEPECAQVCGTWWDAPVRPEGTDRWSC